MIGNILSPFPKTIEKRFLDEECGLFQTSGVTPQNLALDSQRRGICTEGGTAINFFVRELPRLSVDIDLAYLGI